MDLASRLGLTGTPVFLLGTLHESNSVAVSQILAGDRPVSEFVTAVDRVIAGFARGGSGVLE
jgi:hypothetical protein